MTESDTSAVSPWSLLHDTEKLFVGPASSPVSGEIAIPGSKSFTNRALIMAALGDGNSRVDSILRSEDSYWCIDSLKKLGVDVDVDDCTASVAGLGARWRAEGRDLFVGSAGTTARFLCGVLAFSLTEPIVVRATKQMSERPMKGLFDVLSRLGCSIEYLEKTHHFPVRMHPSSETGGEVEMSGSLSSQFISGVLMGAPLAANTVTIRIVDTIVQENYVRMTIAAMKDFGVDVNASSDLRVMSVEPQQYRANDYSIEADASTASYFMALAAVTTGEIKLTNLSVSTLQPDIQVLPVFRQLGCDVTSDDTSVSIKGPERLRGGHTLNMHQFSDTALTIAAIAPFADAPIELTGIEHIRSHESDRISVMCQSLAKLGIRVEERRDAMKIYPGRPGQGQMETFDDHRVAMSLSVLAVAGEGLEILSPGCVSKTCPNFFTLLRELGIQVD